MVLDDVFAVFKEFRSDEDVFSTGETVQNSSLNRRAVYWCFREIPLHQMVLDDVFAVFKEFRSDEDVFSTGETVQNSSLNRRAV